MGSGGVADKCGQFLRCLIVAANFIVLLISIGLAVVVGLVISGMKITSGMTPHLHILAVLGFCMVVILMAMFISFLGCCGAIRESKCMLITYCVIIGILTVLLVVGTVLAALATSVSSLKDLKHELYDSLGERDEVDLWNILQPKLKCCGVVGSSDYKSGIPDSCYASSTNKAAGPYPQGCYSAIETFLQNFSPIAIGCNVALIVFLVISGCAACRVVKSINDYSEFV